MSVVRTLARAARNQRVIESDHPLPHLPPPVMGEKYGSESQAALFVAATAANVKDSQFEL